MPLREVSMPRDYRERVEQVLKEKVPDKLVEEGAPIHHASLGLLVGIVSAILIGLLFLYVFKNFIQAPSKASQDLYELQEVPKYYDKSK
jgi:hypothetical protein